MGTYNINTRLVMKHDLIENWEHINPLLLRGEIGVVRDENTVIGFKIGDGAHNWNDLPIYSPQAAIGKIKRDYKTLNYKYELL